MRFKHGTHVYTSDEHDVGTIDRVVVDPSTNEVSELVIRKGWLFTEDKVVHMDMVASATEDRVTLRKSQHELDNLPEFEERYYIPAHSQDEQAGLEVAADTDIEPLYSYPPLGTPWWGYGNYGGALPPVGAEPIYAERVKQNIPAGTIALKEGARVYSNDGKHVGDIEEIFTDEATNQVTHLVISHGILFKENKLIPTNWVKVPGEDEVILSVATSLIDELPPYNG